MINVLIKNKILLLIFITTAFWGNDGKKYQQLINDSSYFVVDIDINKDGFRDKVISHKAIEGNELYFITNKNKIVYKGYNFSQDGGNKIGKIQQENNNLFSITTNSDKMNYKEKYFIDYINNSWIITEIIYSTNYWQDDYSKTYICKVKQNIKINDYDNIKPIPSEQERDELCIIKYYMEESLEEFLQRFKEENNTSILGVSRYKSLLSKFTLKKKNLTKYNNIAYYLEKAGAYKESIYLLEKIIEKYPNRTVAYINLGDAYLKDGNKIKAIKNYKIYVNQMKDKNKEKKIPKRVLEVIDNSKTPIQTMNKQDTSQIEPMKKEEKTFFTKLLELFGSSISTKNIMQS